MSKNLRVVHVVLCLEVGGLEHVVIDLVREGQALGVHSTIICLERTGPLADHAAALGVKVIHVAKQPGVQLKTIRAVEVILRQINPAVVHTHQISALFYAGPAARRAKVPVIVHTEHGKHYAARLRTRLLGRIASRNTQRFFCVSKDLAAEVRAWRIAAPEKIAVIPNGIPTARFTATGDGERLRQSLGIPQEVPVIGTVGRLTEVKRQDLLIRAFALVHRKYPECRLLILGDGPLRDSLDQLAARLGVRQNVTFAGYQPEPEKYLHLMDAFALTSRSEGMPRAVLEAWAVGVPVIASKVGGMVEMIDDGTNGLLFDFPNVDLLADALVRVLAQPVLAASIRQAAGDHVRQHFDSGVMASAYLREYDDLLKASRNGSL